MRDDTPLRIEETREGAWARLVLIGELDIATARQLRERIHQLKEAGSHVRLNLSELEFIDTGGAHVLAEALAESRADHWRLEVEPNLSHQVGRFLDLARGAGWNIDI
jgi:anti-anti-sigma factor